MGRIPFNEQIRNFENTLNQITANLGADEAAASIGKCIFFVGMGSNDYLNNYLMPNYPTRNQYNAQQYASLLTQTYTQQLTVRFLISSFSIYHLMKIPELTRKFMAEALQSWSKEICGGRAWLNGMYSQHFGSKYEWRMLRRSEPACSTFQ